jgi:hypothetical protein
MLQEFLFEKFEGPFLVSNIEIVGHFKDGLLPVGITLFDLPGYEGINTTRDKYIGSIG